MQMSAPCFNCCSLTQSCPTLATPWTAAWQASLYFTISRGLLKFLSTELVILSNHHILCHPILHLLSIFPSIRVFSNELALHTRWPKYWRFSFSISPSSEYSGLISFRIDCFARSLGSLKKHWTWSLEKEMATHSSILTWIIPWTEEPGGLVHRVTKSQTRTSD